MRQQRERSVWRRWRRGRHCSRPVRRSGAVALVLAPRPKRLRQEPRAGCRAVRGGLLHEPDLRARRGGLLRVRPGRYRRQAPAVARGTARPRRRAGLCRRAAAVARQVTFFPTAPPRRRARAGDIAGLGGVVGARGDRGDGAVVGGLHVRHLPRAQPEDGAHLRRPRRGGRRRDLAAADQSAGARRRRGLLELVIHRLA
jgi:hypothetical protein